MSFGSRLKERRKAMGITQEALGEILGVSGNAIGNYEKGISSPNANALYELFDILKCDANYLFQDDVYKKDNNDLSFSEMETIKKYRTLDEYGKQAVDAVLNVENERCELKQDQIEPEQPKTKIIPLFGNSFAAGTPEPDFGNLWQDYEVPIDSRAEFAIKINGKSMEPYLQDGSIALGVKRKPRIGEIAALQIDGGYVCKQYCDDSFGNLYLFSLNREYKDISIMSSGNQTVGGIGTILIDKKLPPLPDAIND